MTITRTDEGEDRRAQLERTLDANPRDARYGDHLGALAQLVRHLWWTQPDLAIIVPKRVRCPACNRNGAKFIRCAICGGPMCDNCQNEARGQEMCYVCREKGTTP